MANLTTKEIVAQSNAAYDQWKDQWREHCKIHKDMGITSTFFDFMNMGVGKALLIVANGYSLEENIEVIKKHQNNVDIMVCDKAIGHLLDHGIVPDFCVVCDANVDADVYIMKWKDQLSQTTLFNNVCGNPEWTKLNWKNKCLFVNKDSISSEKEFSELSGCSNFVPAATNVSNEMVVLATQSTNEGRNNWMGYDKIILIGFDYCWSGEKSYYAFDQDGSGKMSYMKHAYVMDRNLEHCFSSSNLIFSAKWLDDYIKAFRLPVVSGTKRTLLQNIPCKDLEEQLQYSYRQEDGITVRGLSQMRAQLAQQLDQVTRKISAIGMDHWHSFMTSI